MALTALQAIAAKLATDIATLVAQEQAAAAQNVTLEAAAANQIQQSDVDAITASLTTLDASVVAQITPAAPVAPAAS